MQFKSKTRQQENELIKNDDPFFIKTKIYLKPLIISALNHFDLTKDLRNKLLEQIVEDIPVAVKKYLKYKNNEKKYKFCTYFTWYIAQRINAVKDLKRK